jgi:hypothetical protein
MLLNIYDDYEKLKNGKRSYDYQEEDVKFLIKLLKNYTKSEYKDFRNVRNTEERAVAAIEIAEGFIGIIQRSAVDKTIKDRMINNIYSSVENKSLKSDANKDLIIEKLEKLLENTVKNPIDVSFMWYDAKILWVNKLFEQMNELIEDYEKIYDNMEELYESDDDDIMSQVVERGSEEEKKYNIKLELEDEIETVCLEDKKIKELEKRKYKIKNGDHNGKKNTKIMEIHRKITKRREEITDEV